MSPPAMPNDAAPPANGARVQRERTAGRWLVFAATVFWASTATLARWVFRDRHVPPLTVVELRLAIAATLLLAMLLARRPAALRIARRDLGYFVTLGLFGVAAVQGSYYFTISRLGVGLAILLQYLAPALIVAFDFTRGARPTRATALALLAAIGGTALLVGNVDPAALHARPLDWAVGFGSAFAFAFYILFSKRGLERYAPQTVLLYTFLIAGVFWSCVTPLPKILAAGYGPELWGMFLLLGVFSTLVPFTLFYLGLKHLPAAEAGIVATLEPVVAIVSAWLLLGERLAPLQWLGALLVLVASVIASRGRPEEIAAQAERA